MYAGGDPVAVAGEPRSSGGGSGVERPWILDGGLATALEDRGLALHPRLWSAGVFLERPEAVEAVHRAYLRSGAEILITASYQMTLAGLEREGLTRSDAVAALRATVRAARHACEHEGRAAMVAASVGSYGAARADGSEYRGDYGLSPGALVEHHRPTFEILCGSGAELLAIETIPSLDEARAFVELLATRRRARAWISFTCRDGRRLGEGQPIREASRLLDRCPQVVAIGVNCCAPEHVASLIAEIRRGSGKPIVVYPNSGEAWDPAARRWSGSASAPSFVELARGWAAQGAWAIGGCCRIGPGVIRSLALALGGHAVRERPQAGTDPTLDAGGVGS